MSINLNTEYLDAFELSGELRNTFGLAEAHCTAGSSMFSSPTSWPPSYPPAGEGKAGLHVDTIRWMHERRIAAFLPDGDGETIPSNVEGILYPVHPLQVTAMGMFAADSLQLEDLATACEEEGRFEFMVVGLPLRLPGGTGSPWNPIAIF